MDLMFSCALFLSDFSRQECMFIIRATVGHLNVASESPVLLTSGANP